MRYQVTFRLGGDERTETVDALDAASAVNQIQFEHGRGEDLFELISVTLDESIDGQEDQAED